MSRILLSSVLACLEVYENSAQVQLFAFGPESGDSNARTIGMPIGIYKPPDEIDSTIARMECSQISLSGKRKDRAVDHLLEDGEGIFTIALEKPNHAAMTDDGDAMEWNTACGMIRPLHNAAVVALAQQSRPKQSDSPFAESQTPVYEYRDWADKILSWLPAGTEPPTRHAICGYRLATAVPANEEVGPNDKHKAVVRLTIFDFTPAHIARQLSVACMKYGATEPPGIQSANSRSSVEDGPAGSRSPAVSTIVTTSWPNRAGQPVFEYATKSPYLMASRNIWLARAERPFVVRLTQDQLVLLQVRRFSSLMPT